MSKSRNLKSEKLSKLQKSAKLKKKSSKNKNSPNFGAIKVGSKFLTSNAKTAFNRLWLAFIEALIFWHFNPEYNIWIETDVLDYTIDGVQR